MSSTSNLQPPSSRENNYEMWSLTMKDFFRGQDVWENVKNGYVELVDKETCNSLTQGIVLDTSRHA